MATNPLAGKGLDYSIGVDAAQPRDGHVLELGYDAETLPTGSIGYANLYDQRNTYSARTNTGDFGPYLSPTGTAAEYREGRVNPEGAGWWPHIDQQIDKWLRLSAAAIEWDNTDGYAIGSVLTVYDRTQRRGLSVLAKNPGDARLVGHSAVVGVIQEYDDGLTPPALVDRLERFRTACGKPFLPVRFVSFDTQRPWAAAIAWEIDRRNLREMGVTYDGAANEYGGTVEDIRLPTPAGTTMPDPQPAAVTGADIIARARSYRGKFVGDGPDIPRLAQEVARGFPDMASYAALAGATTEWCGIFCAKVLTEFGIRPPFGADDVHRWMWVDAWKDFGTPIARGQEQPGDVAMWFGSPHHVSFVAGSGMFCGGNQGGGSGAVTEFRLRDPDAIRRPPVAGAIAARPIDENDPSALPLLVHGDVGPYVEKLQKLLGSIEVDGEFGDDTKAAVEAFQASHAQLQVDGEVGPQTWAALLGKAPPISDEPPRYLQYRAGYAAQWKQMVIDPGKTAQVAAIARRCIANKARYQAASAKTGVPWFVIAAWHDRESSGDFSTQLAQGDPLNQVSHNVPAGRGPFSTWEAGAFDALVTLKALNTVSDWTIERICYESERYNGFGYRSRGVPSAYLWSFSNIYTGGKFVSDGNFSMSARDAQCGVMPLIKQIAALDSTVVLRSYESTPPSPPQPLPPDEGALPDTTDKAIAAEIKRIDGVVTDLRKRVAALEGKPMATDPVPPAKPDPAAIEARFDKLETLLQSLAASPPKQSPMYQTIKTLTGLIPGVGVYGSIIAYVVVAFLQAKGIMGTAAGIGGEITATGSAITSGLGGTFIAGLLGWIGQRLKPKAQQ